MFFFHDTATTEIYTLSLHDALPICSAVAQRIVAALVERPLASDRGDSVGREDLRAQDFRRQIAHAARRDVRSEEHTSELQSQFHLVCRLLLEKKKKENLQHYLIYTT